MKIYMEVSRDKYSLPLAVADSAKELAELRGVKRNNIESIISNTKKNGWNNPKYIVVEVDEEEDDA